MNKLCIIVALVLVAPLLQADRASAAPYSFTPYDGTTFDTISTLDQLTHLNRARCVCDRQTTPTVGSLWVGVTDPGPYTTDDVYFYVGTSCDDPLHQPDCWEAGVLSHSSFTSEQLLMLPINRVVDPVGGECLQVNGTTTLHVLQGDASDLATATFDLEVRTLAPPSPTNATVTALSDTVEAGVRVQWDHPATGGEDIQRYNVLCEVRSEPAPMSDIALADWLDSLYICGQELDPEGVPHNILCTDSLAESAWPRRCYVCASVDAATTDVLITGLPTDRVVRFSVVAVDDAENVSRQSNVTEIDTETMLAPGEVPVYDCACRGGRGAGSVPLGLLLMLVLGWIWRRGRRRG